MWIVVALVGTGLLTLLAPAEVNGDGIGYLKAVREGARYPGHLGYVPLLSAAIRAAHWLGGGTGLSGGIVPGRLLSALAGGLAAALLGIFLERRTGDRKCALSGAAGLLCSAGFLVAGSDIECYAPALLAIVATLALLETPTVGRAALAGLTLAAAVLLHIENVLFLGPAWLLCGGTRARVALLAACGPMLAVAYAPLLGEWQRATHGATHGYSYPLRLETPLIAVWGALRTLVYAPYPHEASLAVLVVATTAGAVVASVLIFLAARSASRTPLPVPVLVAWIVPYALVGAAFFASDSERWVFLLPLAWIALAARVPPRRLGALVAIVLACNLALWLPHARDRAGVDRARAVAARLSPRALVVCPGHGWDESLPLYAEVELFPVVYFAASEGGEAGMLRALDDRLVAARTRGATISSVRISDDDRSPLGYKELAAFGLDRARLRALVEARGVGPATP